MQFSSQPWLQHDWQSSVEQPEHDVQAHDPKSPQVPEQEHPAAVPKTSPPSRPFTQNAMARP